MIMRLLVKYNLFLTIKLKTSDGYTLKLKLAISLSFNTPYFFTITITIFGNGWIQVSYQLSITFLTPDFHSEILVIFVGNLIPDKIGDFPSSFATRIRLRSIGNNNW